MKLPCARISLLRILKPGEALVLAGTSNAAACAASRAGVSITQARRLLVDPVSGDSLECRLVALSDETPPGAAPEPVIGYQSEGTAP
jgi:hypothetical protein